MRHLGVLIFTVVLFLLAMNVAVAQRGTPFFVTKELKVEGISKDKLYKKSKKFLEGLENVTLTRWNDDQKVVEASSSINYSNDVVLEDIFLSPNAALRTKGVINFVIRITSMDGLCRIEFVDFTHEAFYNRYGKISMGLILNNDKAPLDRCFENTAWCNAVWDDMKSKTRRHCLQLIEEAKKKID